jgi:hypothetical protein
MAKEKSLWEMVSAAMYGLWHVQRHEDKHSVGIPDVSFGMKNFNGWIELKHLEKWPPSGNIIKIPHFTPQQANWLFDRDLSGGNCWLLLRVGNEYIFIRGKNVLEVGYVEEDAIRELADAIFTPTNIKQLRMKIYTVLMKYQ